MKRLFYVGQQVICINDDFKWSRKHFPNPEIKYPVFGQRYNVRAYVVDGKCPAIVLQEFTNPSVPYLHEAGIREAGFWDHRFVGAPPPIESKLVTKKEKEVA